MHRTVCNCLELKYIYIHNMKMMEDYLGTGGGAQEMMSCVNLSKVHNIYSYKKVVMKSIFCTIVLKTFFKTPPKWATNQPQTNQQMNKHMRSPKSWFWEETQNSNPSLSVFLTHSHLLLPFQTVGAHRELKQQCKGHESTSPSTPIWHLEHLCWLVLSKLWGFSQPLWVCCRCLDTFQTLQPTTPKTRDLWFTSLRKLRVVTCP